jgi:hypothetical protein
MFRALHFISVDVQGKSGLTIKGHELERPAQVKGNEMKCNLLGFLSEDNVEIIIQSTDVID